MLFSLFSYLVFLLSIILAYQQLRFRFVSPSKINININYDTPRPLMLLIRPRLVVPLASISLPLPLSLSVARFRCCCCSDLPSPPCVAPSFDYCTTQQPFFLFFFSSMTTWLAEVGPGTTCFETWPSEVTPLLLSALPPPAPAALAPPAGPPAAALPPPLLPWEFVPFCAVAWFCEICQRKRGLVTWSRWVIYSRDQRVVEYIVSCMIT